MAASMMPTSPFVPLVALLLLSCGQYGAAKTTPLAKNVKVGIVAAYLPEYQNVVGALTGRQNNFTSGSRLWTTGQLGGKKVVVTMCGIGMTNMAMTSQMMILLFKPTYILNTGIAGGIDPKIRIGDVVIPKAYVDPDMKKLIRTLFENDTATTRFITTGTDFPDKFYVTANESAGFYGMGLPPGYDTSKLALPSKEFLASIATTSTVSSMYAIPMEVEVLTKVADTFMTPTPPTMFVLPASQIIIQAALRAIPKVNLSQGLPGMVPLPYQPIAEVVERGMSSNTFVDNADYRKLAFELFHPSCVEMEGHALLHVCLSNKVECGVVRSVSDLAGGEPGQDGESEIGTFFAIAALNTQIMLTAIIKELPC